jgi:uncharacterized membrane protein (UPF0127 family)
MPTRLLFLLALVLLFTGCASGPSLPTVELKGKRFSVEIADDFQEQAQGMMFRRELARDHGMLFVYDQAQPQAFWMRNCHIPLDILYFDAEARFINGHYNAPPCNAQQCPNYVSDRPAKYVLEVAGGVAKAMNLAAGDVLTLPPADRLRD